MTESLIAPIPDTSGALDDAAPPGPDGKATADAAALIYQAASPQEGAAAAQTADPQAEEAGAETPAEEAAPVAYEPFALPSGVEVDTAALEEAQSLFAEARLSRFGTPQLRRSLDELGVSNSPQLFRFFVRVGQAVSEDRYAGRGLDASERSAAETLYPDIHNDK